MLFRTATRIDHTGPHSTSMLYAPIEEPEFGPLINHISRIYARTAGRLSRLVLSVGTLDIVYFGRRSKSLRHTKRMRSYTITMWRPLLSASVLYATRAYRVLDTPVVHNKPPLVLFLNNDR